MSASFPDPPPLAPPPGAPPRLTRRDFPAYRYVPDVEPHPSTDPRGHSYGAAEEPLELGDLRLPRDWRSVGDYLYGIDLFNAAFFWEAHESWEAIWHAVGHETLVGRCVQGLIQAAAALLQHHRGRVGGARTLLERSRSNLEGAHDWMARHGRSTFMGVDLAPWQSTLEAYVEGESSDFPFLRVS